MPFSVRLTEEEEALLAAAAARTSRSKSELVREGVRELCLRLVGTTPSPYESGKTLFGGGKLAKAPRDPRKRVLWEKVRAKHSRLG